MPTSRNLIDKTVYANLQDDPVRLKKYQKIKQFAVGIFSSGYDISNTCNLKCEGCMYFSGEGVDNYTDNKSPEQYETFFAREVARGVNYPFLAGAETSLQPERLRLANKYWKHGMVFTNGIIPIDRDISFSIHVSLWGETISGKLRGADIFRKSLANYKNDARATFIFTITGQNLNYLEKVIKTCIDENLRLSFNHYSPTTKYATQITRNAPHDEKHFRISDKTHNLYLTNNDLQESHDLIAGYIDRYPANIIYSHFYNDWISNPDGIYNLDQNGVATDCATLNANFHVYYRINHAIDASTKNCCCPFVDCKMCKLYAFSYPSLLTRMRRYLKVKYNFVRWLDAYDTWCRMAFVGWEKLDPEATDTSAFWQR